MKLTKINRKYELLLPDHRADRPEWATGWEVERIESMLSNLKEGDLVIDIGTEEGDISALLARKTGKIILFEPNPKVWPNIRAIWEANNLAMPLAYWVGFAANQTDSTMLDQSFDKWPSCTENELIGNHGFKELSDPDNIPMTRIDDFLPSVTTEKVKLITVDVEGSEFEVVKGAVETLKNHRPLLYVSLHPDFMYHHFQQHYLDFIKFVEDLGYKKEVLAIDHEIHLLFKPL